VIRWLLDTNVVIEMLKPDRDPRVRAWVAGEAEASLAVSVLTIAEFAQGAGKLPDDDPDRPRVEAELAIIESNFAGRIIPVDHRVAVRFGFLSGLLRRSGRKPPVIDTLLAATAIEHGLVLVTRNTRDVAATGAGLFDPWQQPAAGPAS
jgi:toxin FitB